MQIKTFNKLVSILALLLVCPCLSFGCLKFQKNEGKKKYRSIDLSKAEIVWNLLEFAAHFSGQ